MNTKQHHPHRGWLLSALLLLLFVAVEVSAQSLEPFNGYLDPSYEAYTFCWTIPQPFTRPGSTIPDRKTLRLVFQNGADVVSLDNEGVFSYERPDGFGELIHAEIDGYQILPDGNRVYTEPGSDHYYTLEMGFEEGEEQNVIIPIVIVINWPKKKTET